MSKDRLDICDKWLDMSKKKEGAMSNPKTVKKLSLIHPLPPALEN